MERFVWGDSSRHTEGSGLGLSIAREFDAIAKWCTTYLYYGDLLRRYWSFRCFADFLQKGCKRIMFYAIIR